MSGEIPLREVLKDLASILGRSGIRWYVFGAQAVIVWGRPRMTADLDVTVDVPISEAGSFVDRMRVAGFTLRIDDFAAWVSRTRVLPFVHDHSAIPVDVVLAGPGLEVEFLDRAIVRDVGGALSIPVISPEDLLVTKILAGRPKDVEDVRTILRERLSELDVSRVRAVLSQIEQALDRSDLIDTFEKEVERVNRSDD